jgi:acetyl-CoA carboxylase carboxyltransferase component
MRKGDNVPPKKPVTEANGNTEHLVTNDEEAIDYIEELVDQFNTLNDMVEGREYDVARQLAEGMMDSFRSLHNYLTQKEKN